MELEKVDEAIRLAQKAADILVEIDSKDSRLEVAQDGLDDAITALKDIRELSGRDEGSFAEKKKESLSGLFRAYDAVVSLDVDFDGAIAEYGEASDAINEALDVLL